MNLIFPIILSLLCAVSNTNGNGLYRTEREYNGESLIESDKRILTKRSADLDNYENHDSETRCISCGKLGGSYSASASASAAASASASGASPVGSKSYPMQSVPNYNYNYNTYPRESSYTKSRESSTYGTQNIPVQSYPSSGSRYSSSSSYSTNNVPVNSYPSSESSYSSSSSYQNRLPSVAPILPATSSDKDSKSSYYYSQSRSAQSQPNSYGNENIFQNSDFDREIARMRESLNQGNHFSGTYPTYNNNNAGSHHSEYQSESRYINGKPVYEKKTEKRYKDGEIVHHFHSEKDSDDLGTSHLIDPNSQPSPYQSSHSYSNQYSGSDSSSAAVPVNHAHRNVIAPIKKEKYYSESWSSSNQPIHSGQRYLPADYYSQTGNTHRDSYSRPEIRNPIPATTNSLESTYEEDKFVSHIPIHNTPISNSISKETTVNITSSSRTADVNPKINNVNPGYIASKDQLTNFQRNNIYTENNNRPHTDETTNAHHTSRKSYIKESKYSSGINTRDNAINSEDESLSRRPYNRIPSISESAKHYKQLNRQSSDRNSERSDISPYHESEEETDTTNDYLARSSPQTIAVDESNEADKDYQPRKFNVPQRSNVNIKEVMESQRKVERMPYQSPTFTRLPSRWLEVKTTYKYRNGKLVGETRYNKLFENGVLINQNVTERTREQMANEGIDVVNLDLKLVPVNQPKMVKAHEVRYVKETSETHHQPVGPALNQQHYLPTSNVMENRYMESNDRYNSGNRLNYQDSRGNNNYRAEKFRESNQFTHHQPVTPITSDKRHEVYEEEKYINGGKIYDLHHERIFKDNKLIRENKTELLPKDLGVDLESTNNSYYTKQNENRIVQPFPKNLGVNFESTSNSYYNRQNTNNRPQQFSKDLGVNIGSTSNSYYTRQNENRIAQPIPDSRSHSSSQNNFRSSCVTCGLVGINGFSLLNQTNGVTRLSHQSPQSTIITGSNHGEQDRSMTKTFREDVDIEEYYENGKLVKGQEENKKWKDGRLIDRKSETYDQGPSRTSTYNFVNGGGVLPSLQHATTHSRNSRREEECDVNQCQNGATCRMSASRSPICLCKFGFNGNFCETAYCPSRFCRYGGACSIINDHHVCSCQEGFTGHRCKTRVHNIRVPATG